MRRSKGAEAIISLEMILLGSNERIKSADLIEKIKEDTGLTIERKTLYTYIEILKKYYNINFVKRKGWILE